MRKILSSIRKLTALAIAIPLIVVGVILLPLPGPGLLIIGVGFFILSIEFAFAEKWLTKAVNELKNIYDKALEKYHERLDKIDKM